MTHRAPRRPNAPPTRTPPPTTRPPPARDRQRLDQLGHHLTSNPRHLRGAKSRANGSSAAAAVGVAAEAPKTSTAAACRARNSASARRAHACSTPSARRHRASGAADVRRRPVPVAGWRPRLRPLEYAAASSCCTAAGRRTATRHHRRRVAISFVAGRRPGGPAAQQRSPRDGRERRGADRWLAVRARARVAHGGGRPAVSRSPSGAERHLRQPREADPRGGWRPAEAVGSAAARGGEQAAAVRKMLRSARRIDDGRRRAAAVRARRVRRVICVSAGGRPATAGCGGGRRSSGATASFNGGPGVRSADERLGGALVLQMHTAGRAVNGRVRTGATVAACKRPSHCCCGTSHTHAWVANALADLKATHRLRPPPPEMRGADRRSRVLKVVDPVKAVSVARRARRLRPIRGVRASCRRRASVRRSDRAQASRTMGVDARALPHQADPEARRPRIDQGVSGESPITRRQSTWRPAPLCTKRRHALVRLCATSWPAGRAPPAYAA